MIMQKVAVPDRMGGMALNIEYLASIETIREFFGITSDGKIPDAAAMLLESMTEVIVPDGCDIVTYGHDCADGMYIILEGKAEVLSATGDVINAVGKGDFIGELGLINDMNRKATVRAAGECRCANISRRIFEEIAVVNRKIYGVFINMLYSKTTKLVTERARIKADLEIATRIQTGLLENDFTPFERPGISSICARMHPAKEVGGDFYDVFMIDQDRIVFLIADVSGKGVSAALYTMLAKTHLRNYAELGLPLAEVVSRANNQLCKKNEENMFVTAFVCCYDYATGVLTYVNAGHNKPFVYHQGGTFDMLQCRPNFVLGGMENARYREYTTQLKAGDTIYLYTDGTTEATNPNEELFGDDRCRAALNACADVADQPEALLKRMYATVDRFADGAEQADDITMVCFALKPQE